MALQTGILSSLTQTQHYAVDDDSDDEYSKDPTDREDDNVMRGGSRIQEIMQIANNIIKANKKRGKKRLMQTKKSLKETLQDESYFLQAEKV